MKETHDVQLAVDGRETGIGGHHQENVKNSRHSNTETRARKYKFWILLAIYAFLILSGGSAATLLGRLYYEKGGKSKWLATLIQLAGFPALLPFIYISNHRRSTSTQVSTNPFSWIYITSIYAGFGLLLAAICMLFAVGLQYLPVSTCSLILASQLAFSAIFSVFLNAQKFTPFIVNSLVLLSLSSITLMVHGEDSTKSADSGKHEYITGFLCAIFASAGWSLFLCLTQLYFDKVFVSGDKFTEILRLLTYQSIVATCASSVGLFVSGEWEGLKSEMESFQPGEVAYLMTLIWTAVGWQVFNIGTVGIIVESSSLFSNVLGTLSIPIIPVFAAIFFDEPLNGTKIISMGLAIWGFVSYMYQYYLDDNIANIEETPGDQGRAK